MGGAGNHALLSFAAELLALQDVEASDDRRQKIVEVVCDSAGQLPDRLQLLRLSELSFDKRKAFLLVERLRDVEIDQKSLTKPGRHGLRRFGAQAESRNDTAVFAANRVVGEGEPGRLRRWPAQHHPHILKKAWSVRQRPHR